MTDKAELKACPFCGSEAGGGWVKFNSMKSDAFQVGCSGQCECMVEEDSESEAITAWNTRHGDTA